MMHVGTRIHKAHVGKNIEYIAADTERHDLPGVSANGVGYKSREIAGERRKMACSDCHNRPTHAFDMPATTAAAALEAGELDRTSAYLQRDGGRQLMGK